MLGMNIGSASAMLILPKVLQSAQRLQQLASCLEVVSVEAFGEAVVDRREQLARDVALALVLPIESSAWTNYKIDPCLKQERNPEVPHRRCDDQKIRLQKFVSKLIREACRLFVSPYFRRIFR